jgi:spore coat polysaccharide biosynthesis protein SpsF
MTTDYLAILQARFTSRRLPGKVLMPILGAPMLEHHIARLRRSLRISRLVLATSVDASDDPVAGLARKLGVDCYRGSLEDVLERFHAAAARYRARNIVRLTGDCPLADWEIIDRVIELHELSGADFASNTIERTYPRGLDVEVFTGAALERAQSEAMSPYEREHVTPYIEDHPEHFSVANLAADRNLSHWRWTVDEPEDFRFVEQVYGKLYPAKPDFRTADIVALLEREPHLQAVNRHVRQQEQKG